MTIVLLISLLINCAILYVDWGFGILSRYSMWRFMECLVLFEAFLLIIGMIRIIWRLLNGI